jgi:hypothetical protein
MQTPRQARVMDKNGYYVKRDAALRELKEKGLSVRQIERLTGINIGVVFKA